MRTVVLLMQGPVETKILKNTNIIKKEKPGHTSLINTHAHAAMTLFRAMLMITPDGLAGKKNLACRKKLDGEEVLLEYCLHL